MIFPQGLTDLLHEDVGAAGLADLNPRLLRVVPSVVKRFGSTWSPYRQPPAKSAYRSGDNKLAWACSVPQYSFGAAAASSFWPVVLPVCVLRVINAISADTVR